MKAIRCEMCGGTDLIKTDGVYVCQHCGMKYAPEEAKKLLVNVSGSVVVDNSGMVSNLYQLARRAKSAGNSEDAANYYGQILLYEPDSWEASFYATLYKSMSCTVADISGAAKRVSSSLRPTVELIKKSGMSEKKQIDKIEEIGAAAIRFADTLFTSARSAYMGISADVRDRFKDEYNARILAIAEVDGYVGYLLEDYADVSTSSKTYFLMAHRKRIAILNSYETGMLTPQNVTDLIARSEEKIRKYDQDYKAPQPVNGCMGCGCLLVIAFFIWLFFLM